MEFKIPKKYTIGGQDIIIETVEMMVKITVITVMP